MMHTKHIEQVERKHGKYDVHIYTLKDGREVLIDPDWVNFESEYTGEWQIVKSEDCKILLSREGRANAEMSILIIQNDKKVEFPLRFQTKTVAYIEVDLSIWAMLDVDNWVEIIPPAKLGIDDPAVEEAIKHFFTEDVRGWV